MTTLEHQLDETLRKAPSACPLREARRETLYLEARRAMEICNACRYCEGFCAVFPAMTLRREFEDRDLDYLANLCHNCRGCFYSCQYAPPHAFGVNVPKLFAELRLETYEKYAWPRFAARLFRRNGTFVSLGTMLVIALVLILTMSWSPTRSIDASNAPGSFYRVISWDVMAGVAGATFCFSILSLSIGAVRFWRATGGGSIAKPRAAGEAAIDVLTLRNLGGGGDGCNDLDERYSMLRRRFHHALFYGFMLCFAATSVATLYHHWLGLEAPYPLLSLPVQLGLWGGIGMTVGTAGLAWVKIVSDPAPAARTVLGADFALLMLLGLTAVTGLLLLALRATALMPVTLAVHLGGVLTFFVLLPYSKMVHGVYRSLSLLRNAIERRRGKA